jgi:dienelactone hydrolase
MALAPDGLFPVGGYPGNDDDGRALQAKLDQGKLRTDMVNSARFLKSHAMSSGKLGVTGFCWGGGTTNYLAATLGAEMSAGVPFYGPAAETASVPNIKAPLLVQYAESDERINAMWPAYEAALKANGVPYEMFIYPGTQHGFHNNSTPRYNEGPGQDRLGPHHRVLQEEPGRDSPVVSTGAPSAEWRDLLSTICRLSVETRSLRYAALREASVKTTESTNQAALSGRCGLARPAIRSSLVRARRFWPGSIADS